MIKSWRLAVPAFLVRLDEQTAQAIANDPRVVMVEQNRGFDNAPSEALELDTAASARNRVASNAVTIQEIDDCDNPVPPSPCTDNWGLDRIDADPGVPLNEAYGYRATGFGVHVFVFDRGIHVSHPQLGGRVLDGFPVNTAMSDQQGNSHGTRVASIIGGSISGVAKKVYFHSVFQDSSTDKILDGFEWIATQRTERNLGPAVINASWNIPKLSSDPLYNANFHAGVIGLAARSMVEQYGIPLVTSAGNRGSSPRDFTPSDLGSIEGLIVVGGSAHDDTRWRRKGFDPDYNALCAASNVRDCGSNFGPGIDIWAPAEWIYAATKDGGGSVLSGTSFAAPHVTGVMALYLQQNPSATPAQVEAALRNNALTGQLTGIGTSPNRLLNTRPPLIQDLDLVSLAPTARNDQQSTAVDTPVSVNVLYNDFDRNGSALSIVSLSDPPHGSAQLQGQSVLYTPDNNYAGSDSFTYTISDGTQTATATVTIQVNADRPPFALPNHFVMGFPNGQPPAQPLQFYEGTLLNNDRDEQAVRWVSTGQPAGATLNRVPEGVIFRYDFMPNAGQPVDFTYQFPYTIEDQYAGDDGILHEDTTNVYITTFNRVGTMPLPTANPDTAYTATGSAASFNVLTNDPVALTVISATPPQDGQLSWAPNGAVTYTPAPGFTGHDGFTYVVRDNNGNLGATHVTIQIGGNRAPVARHDGIKTPVGQSVVIAHSTLLGNDTDADSDVLKVQSWTTPTVGQLTAGQSTLTYTPTPAFNGNAQFTYTITDGRGGLSTATVVVQAGEPASANLPPVGGANTFTVPTGTGSFMRQDADLLANDSDPEGGPLSVCGYEDLTQHGTLSSHINGFTYVPGPSFWTTGSDQFRYLLNDRDCYGTNVPVTVTLLAQVRIADSFTGMNNLPLDGRITDIGQRTWDASPGAVIFGNFVTASGSAIGSVPFNPATLPPNTVIKIKAGLSPNGSNWTAIGFSSTSQGPFWNDGQVWVLLRPTGIYVVHSNGTQAPLGSGTVPGWQPTRKVHEVELSYNITTRMTSVVIDGATVLASQQVGFQPNILYAGFHLYNGVFESTRLDDFEVSINP